MGNTKCSTKTLWVEKERFTKEVVEEEEEEAELASTVKEKVICLEVAQSQRLKEEVEVVVEEEADELASNVVRKVICLVNALKQQKVEVVVAATEEKVVSNSQILSMERTEIEP